MFVEIKDNKLLSWCEKPYLDYQYVDTDYSTFDPEKFKVEEGKLVDISDTSEYKSNQAEKLKVEKLKDFKMQIDVIDTKRIRAIAEPALKDSESGQTWLEYYNSQIKTIREQISQL